MNNEYELQNAKHELSKSWVSLTMIVFEGHVIGVRIEL